MPILSKSRSQIHKGVTVLHCRKNASNMHLIKLNNFDSWLIFFSIDDDEGNLPGLGGIGGLNYTR